METMGARAGVSFSRRWSVLDKRVATLPRLDSRFPSHRLEAIL